MDILYLLAGLFVVGFWLVFWYSSLREKKLRAAWLSMLFGVISAIGWGGWYLIRRRGFLAAVALQASPDQPDRRASQLRTSETVQRREPEVVPSHSFGPSLHTGSYYGLC